MPPLPPKPDSVWQTWCSCAAVIARNNRLFPLIPKLRLGVCQVNSRKAKRASGSAATRQEWDINLGYFIHPNVAFVVGYKNIDQRFTSTAFVANNLGQPIPGLGSTVVDAKLDYSGPTLGLVGILPLGQGFGMYGNFAYGFLSADAHGFAGVNSKSAQYVLVDGGVSWTYRVGDGLANIPVTSVSIFGGYRYQAIEVSDIIPGKTGSDYTSGFLVGVNLTF